MFVFGVLLSACIQELDKSAEDFPDNLEHDNDGDGLTENEGDCDDLNSEVLGPSTWYADADGDGYGDPNVAIVDCQPETGYVSNAEDCLDSDETIFPGNARFELAELCVIDADDDGFGDASPELSVDSGTDCDDSNPTIFPNAVDTCDEIDNDCDGLVDEEITPDAPIWYYDSDLDGYGSASVFIQACDAPAGYVSDYTDCNDSDALSHPNAPEVCDGADNNCNTVIDEDSAIDVLTWYADSDSDGHGDPNNIDYSCTQPVGFVNNSNDCNDLSNAQYPGAPETCNGQDDSCDGEIDEGVLNTFYLDLDGDSFGNALQSVMACSAQPGTVSDSSDCDDTDPLVNPNAAEYCNLRDDDCDGQEDEDSVDATMFYIDSDGDGRGEPSQTLLACPIFDGVSQAPDGYSFYDDDCDDNDASRAPNLPELCSTSIDENCDEDTVLGAVDVTTFYADTDSDGQGNPLFTVDVCAAPYGYVANSDDCNDTDPDVLSGMPEEWERCNGKLDRCEEDIYGDARTPDNERDDDDDGFVECELDVIPVLWEDSNASRPLGEIKGGDCDDTDAYTHPGATEICNGDFENCSDLLYDFQDSPARETDNDSDGFVECSGYDIQTWEGDVNVFAGDDCDDTRDYTYPGAAPLSSTVECLTDFDGDGYADCRFGGCDAVFIVNSEQADLVLIPAGDDPLGRYSISFDFYMMTTEVTEGMWDAVMATGNSVSLMAKNRVNWHEAAMFANAVNISVGKEECYSCSGSTCTEAITPITDCMGYRLPTEWEWEYAARSGTTKDFWTGEGLDLGGDYSDNTCSGLETIEDGMSNPLIGDYAWYCGNNSPNDVKSVAQKLPNGYGLYDMHGNVWEWTSDWWGSSGVATGVNPWNSDTETRRVIRGGGYNSNIASITASERYFNNPFNSYFTFGARLVLRAP